MKVVLSFDDATKGDLKIYELVKKYGLEKNTTFFWPVMPGQANSDKGRESLSDDDMFKIAETCEVGSHTITHRLLTRIPIEEAAREILESRQILIDKFNQPINQFCYPRGYANPDIQKLVQEAGYETARSTAVGYIHESENRYFQQTSVHIAVDRKEYGGKSWFEYALYMLELAQATPNSTYSIFGHSWEMEKYNAWDDFEKLLKKICGII